MTFGTTALFAALLPLAPFQEPAPDAAPAQVLAEAASEAMAQATGVLEEQASPARELPEISAIELDLETLARALPPEAMPEQPISIPAASVRRQLVYQFGRAELESKKLDVFIGAEMNAQLAAGVPPERFGVTQAEIDKAIADTYRQVKEQYPTLNEEDVLTLNGIDVSNLSSLTRQSKLFDLVFLPDNPNEWPALTTEALKARLTEEFVTNLQEGYAERKALEAEQTEEERAQAKASRGMFDMLMRQQVRGALDGAASIETASDGLPAEIAMRINGIEIRTEDVFAKIAPRLTEADIADAEMWLIKNVLVEQALRAEGAWLEGEGWSDAWKAHLEENTGTLFPLEAVAMTFRGFPSMESYTQHYRLTASYENMLASEINDEVLAAHVDQRAGHIINLTQVEPEIILISAFDFTKNRWIEGGWEAAAEEAAAVVDQLVASGGENWDELLEEHSDFWDPPAPTNPSTQQQPQKRKNKGRFGQRNRNEMLQMMGESDYSTYLRGSSIVDEIFFHMEQGEVGGPFLGKHGYYIVRVVRRVPPASRRGLEEENFKSMVRQDFVADRLNRFADELYQAAISS